VSGLVACRSREAATQCELVFWFTTTLEHLSHFPA
jgi:hypothetical protein